MKHFLSLRPRRAVSLLALLLALAISLGCAALGHSLERSRGQVTISSGEAGRLYVPSNALDSPAPAVLLLHGGARGRVYGLELSRRGYTVLLATGEGETAYSWLAGQQTVLAQAIAVLDFGGYAETLNLGSDAEYPPRAVILVGSGAEISVPDACNNVLLFCGGSVEVQESGYFGEGSARRIQPLSEHLQRRAALTAVIDWLGSSLGHPRDGMLSDNSFLYSYVTLLYSFSLFFLVLSALPLYWIWAKRKAKS